MKKIILLGLIALFTIVACQQNAELVKEEKINTENSKQTTLLNRDGILNYVFIQVKFDDKLSDYEKEDSKDCILHTLNLIYIENVGSLMSNGPEVWKCVINESIDDPSDNIIVKIKNESDDMDTLRICNATVNGDNI